MYCVLCAEVAVNQGARQSGGADTLHSHSGHLARTECAGTEAMEFGSCALGYDQGSGQAHT